MPMNRIIREKRKELGFTQEQVAEYLGVSAPAVNKWEKGATYPDITLLPALARLLNVDLNTLLCFHEGLSQQEISHFSKEVIDTIQNSGFEAGFALTMDKVREYPNCGSLIQSAALLLDGALLMSGTGLSDQESYAKQITALYERASKSEDDQIRNKANFMLASKHMGLGEYGKAQEMLDLLPERSALDKGRLQANLFLQQNRLTEAAELLERKFLMMGINEVQITLISLAEIARKEGNDQDADHLAEVSRQTAKLFDLWDYYSVVAPLQIAVAREDIPESIALLKSLLAAALTPWELKKSALYRHIAGKASQESFGAKMLPALLSELRNSPKYEFLQENPAFQELLEQYQSKC